MPDGDAVEGRTDRVSAATRREEILLTMPSRIRRRVPEQLAPRRFIEVFLVRMPFLQCTRRDLKHPNKVAKDLRLQFGPLPFLSLISLTSPPRLISSLRSAISSRSASSLMSSR